MVTYKLHFIRHGMTDGNRTGRYVGRTDVPLCQEGRQELEALKQKYRYPEVQEVYCSPLTRCVQTADILYPDSPRTLVEDLVELSLGDFEGKYMKDLKDNPAYRAWLKESLKNTPPGALETGEQFAQRIAMALQQIFANMTQNHITEAAVIAHGGVLMGLLSAFAADGGMGHLQWMRVFGENEHPALDARPDYRGVRPPAGRAPVRSG